MEKKKNIYEINTRVWLKRFNSVNEKPTLKDVPKEYWQNLYAKGFSFVWLMGIWKTNENIIKDYCFEPGLISEYGRALKDWNEKDVIGSPYSIDIYEVNPLVGTKEELLDLKQYLNSLGIKLILDFVPNHFSVESQLIETNPELFLSASEDFLQRNSYTFFRSKLPNNKIFAHGRDPFFPAWQDTIQVNYFNENARQIMIETLNNLTTMCDGVRCDMAMLALNNIFENTWGGVLSYGNYKKPEKEFWEICISNVKKLRNDFVFIGEAYWDLEWELQRLGFDFTYDKKLLDRIRSENVPEIRSHLMAEHDFQQKSIRFIENHDEERAVISMGIEKSKAAAIITSTVKGMTLFHDGQLEGRKTKLPVQLGREPIEKDNPNLVEFYDKLFRITSSEVFKYGKWEMLNPIPSWETNRTYQNILAWKINYEERKRLIVVNFSREVAQCKIELNLINYPSKFKLKDILNYKTYFRKTDEVINEGLFIELGPFKSHIFSY
ncbi:MAG: glycosidase [Ignavibacteriales bacterium]|nr:glycosidase [Ignavibacteriota bacterium]MCB0746679.1 glycosidase [Ignavibacteriota bacterium]MCB9248600.1 glycosidase [Ignavibacteriales bacterium]